MSTTIPTELAPLHALLLQFARAPRGMTWTEFQALPPEARALAEDAGQTVEAERIDALACAVAGRLGLAMGSNPELLASAVDDRGLQIEAAMQAAALEALGKDKGTVHPRMARGE